MKEFLNTLQENANPAVWSRGVALLKEASFIVDSDAGGELCVRVLLKNRPVHPRVSLWPEEGDAYCDCGDRNDPCLHIVAAALAVKNGIAQKPTAAPDGAGVANQNFLGVSYRFTKKDRNLELSRWICSTRGEFELAESLVSFIGGVQSGRISHPAIATTKEDFQIDTLLTQGSSTVRSVRVLERSSWSKLLKLLENAPQVLLQGEPVKTSAAAFPLIVEICDESDGFRLRRKPQSSIQEVFLPGIVLQSGSPCAILRAAQEPVLDPQQREWVKAEGTFFKQADRPLLVSEVLPSLQDKLTLEINTEKLPRLVDSLPRISLQLEPEGSDTLSILADLVYGDPPIARVRLDQGGRLESLSLTQVPKRDLAMEKSLLRDLQTEHHLIPGNRIKLFGDQAAQFLLAHQKQKNTAPSTLTPRLELGSDGRYELEFQVSESGSLPGSSQYLSGKAVLEAWREGRSFFPVSENQWAILPQDWLSRFGERLLKLLDARRDHMLLPKHLIPQALQIQTESSQPVAPYFETLKKGLEQISAIPEATLPEDLRADLRHYQSDGVKWLQFLAKHGLGAILADDMGLGKTLQALCAIRGRTLIICPTSVISAWKEQINRFRPSLKTHIYHGAQRKLPERWDHQQIVLSTYGILRADQQILLAQDWQTLVLDEAHSIKNPDSQVSQAVHALAQIDTENRFRIALSGTPVENRLDDLWSLFQFVNPGLLGARHEFQENFAGPISRGDLSKENNLRQRVKPFLLRRLKRDVAPELPPRTEVILECELSKDERATYDSLVAATRSEVLEKLEHDGNVMAALEALLRLRQACCHPQLIPGGSGRSSKVELLIETLQDSINSEHRSLVFSQWTSLLDLIEPELTAAGIAFLRLDGTTKNREEIIQKFQDPSGPPVFLLSLKAGGVGLTLTAADHVFILDPWWNPAVEDQAADRAHRIGQTHTVLIHRLVAQNSIEEKILALQEEKRRLAEVVLGESSEARSNANSESSSGALTKAELLQLLAEA